MLSSRVLFSAFLFTVACSSSSDGHDPENVGSTSPNDSADDDTVDSADDDTVDSADDDANDSADDDAVDSADDDAVDSADDDSAPLMKEHAPLLHRPEAVSCDHERPVGIDGTFSGELDNQACVVDSDCTEGKNGRCLDQRGNRCTYDECFEDTDCGQQVCGCEEGFWSEANACLGGDCRVDAECGDNGYCSPSFGGCGTYSGVVAYWCHTLADECLDDTDCEEDAYCALFEEVGHWACQTSGCVG